MTHFRSTFCAAFIALALGACSSKPAPDLYVLRAPDADTAMHCNASRNLAISRPLARDEYDTKRIAIMLAKTRLTYYTGAVWASPLPDQLRAFLIEDLSRFSQLTVVESEGDDGSASQTLELTIHDASVVNVSQPSAHLRMTAVLRDARSHHVLTRIRVNESVPAEANHMAEIVEAFNQAAANASRKITQAMKLGCRGT